MTRAAPGWLERLVAPLVERIVARSIEARRLDVELWRAADRIDVERARMPRFPGEKQKRQERELARLAGESAIRSAARR